MGMFRAFGLCAFIVAIAFPACAQDGKEIDAQSSVQEIITEKPVPEILREFGFDVRQQRLGNQNFYIVGRGALPPQIIAGILAAPLRDLLTVTGARSITDPIVRFKEIVFNPKGVLTWYIPDRSDDGNYVVLATKKLVLNTPTQLAELARLVIIPHLTSADLRGGDSSPGPGGWSSGTDDGASGGRGGDGPTGGAGKTYTFPAVYMVFQALEINQANPAITTSLRVEAIGIQGGAGGRGGNGGGGGTGSRGTPGERQCPTPITCYCSGGPGDGGNGGNGGSGGKGGDGGRGGSGGTIFFVAPAAELDKAPRVEISQSAAKAGVPGAPGAPGAGGTGGGGGSKPFECINGGRSGLRGRIGSPPNLGTGAQKPDGIDGAAFKTERDNTDLF